DEGAAPGPERRAALESWLRRLHETVRLTPDTTNRNTNTNVVSAFRRTDSRTDDELMLAAAAHSIRTLDLPISLFDDLVSAFAQDTMTTRYASWADVLDYCRRSANPVGRLVLRIAGYRDEALDRSSDALCTALQLTNFWQDFGRDWGDGRLYVPHEVHAAA